MNKNTNEEEFSEIAKPSHYCDGIKSTRGKQNDRKIYD